MRVTLADIAKACDTSLSTVSRALSDPDRVNPQTRERIQRVAREMGYMTNPIARALALGRTGVIGLIVPDIANPFFPPIIKAVQARAGRKNTAVLLADTDEHASDELERAAVLSKQVDGLILVSPRTAEERLAEFIELSPVVFVNRQVEGAQSVIIDNSDGITQAVQHLTALGHRRICYLNGPRRSWSNERRRIALQEACTQYGVELVEFGPFEPQVQAGVRAADLVQTSGTTAVIAYDDLIALGLMARLAEHRLQVGRDVSVIGIDDSPMSDVAYPTLTSIHVPGAEAGTVAVDLLLEQLDDADREQPTLVQLETRLIIRGSTGPAPAAR
ncbi:LacI family DNA-binding transcriptional regulator [Kribbella kalugense]|uniref:LacI family transcriptional regulator n=1 Tax=Kribbella kalugense TaxID=2512221 RepID=A0A4R7ZYS1_9ACTN|nr:LacI family DNA-binding transcriptional regulator [Kribbella kalugense]TDW23202.1 LacI family transcriptional regulator [Kribbella kalugense]